MQPECGPGERISPSSRTVQRACMPCERGTFQPSTKAQHWDVCQPCEDGSYQDMLGQTECKPCKQACSKGDSVQQPCSRYADLRCIDVTLPTISLGAGEDTDAYELEDITIKRGQDTFELNKRLGEYLLHLPGPAVPVFGVVRGSNAPYDPNSWCSARQPCPV